MRQIHRGTRQDGPGALLAGVATFSSPAYGLLARPPRGSRIAAAWRSTRKALDHAVDTMLAWHERVRMRRHLLAMDDRLLRDIGISRYEAYHEAAKPFWRV